jgi:hypothetical protein
MQKLRIKRYKKNSNQDQQTKCSVCNHESAKDIDYRIQRGDAIRNIARDYQINQETLYYHGRHHTPDVDLRDVIRRNFFEKDLCSYCGTNLNFRTSMKVRDVEFCATCARILSEIDQAATTLNEGFTNDELKAELNKGRKPILWEGLAYYLHCLGYNEHQSRWYRSGSPQEQEAIEAEKLDKEEHLAYITGKTIGHPRPRAERRKRQELIASTPKPPEDSGDCDCCHGYIEHKQDSLCAECLRLKPLIEQLIQDSELQQGGFQSFHLWQIVGQATGKAPDLNRLQSILESLGFTENQFHIWNKPFGDLGEGDE